VLTDVLALELVFGNAVYGGGKGTDGVAEFGVSQGELFFGACPVQLYPEGIRGKPGAELAW
jgi:hypothetical protein